MPAAASGRPSRHCAAAALCWLSHHHGARQPGKDGLQLLDQGGERGAVLWIWAPAPRNQLPHLLQATPTAAGKGLLALRIAGNAPPAAGTCDVPLQPLCPPGAPTSQKGHTPRHLPLAAQSRERRAPLTRLLQGTLLAKLKQKEKDQPCPPAPRPLAKPVQTDAPFSSGVAA